MFNFRLKADVPGFRVGQADDVPGFAVHPSGLAPTCDPSAPVGRKELFSHGP
jgi:hypothetical protein